MHATDFYATQSLITDPGPTIAKLTDLPRDLRALQQLTSQLIFHYRADGDLAANQIAPARIAEIDSRYARTIFARLFALTDQPLTTRRAPHERVVGCCRDFSVLFLALARQQGIPARGRVGFASYFLDGWYLDHMIVEAWDAPAQRWRLIDPQLRAGHQDPHDGVVIDPLDLSADRFIVGPQAWHACRTGNANPEQFVVDPGLLEPITRSWPYLAHNLVLDLAALNKHEMILWDAWGLGGQLTHTKEELTILDKTAAAMLAEPFALNTLQQLYQRDGLRLPKTVTTYSPAGSPQELPTQTVVGAIPD